MSVLTDFSSGVKQRPEWCECLPGQEKDDLPCFECFNEGFETPNPNAEDTNNE